jgi:hypothetical protein
MLGENQVNFTCRLSVRMTTQINDLTHSAGDDTTRSQVVQHLLARFFTNPVYVDELDAKELREPLGKPQTFVIDRNYVDLLTSFANKHGTTVSAAFRMAIYLGVIEDGQ